MKPLTNFSRILLFIGCVIWFMTRTSATNAQGQNCLQYAAEDDNPCYTCCSGGMNEMNVYLGYPLGPGITDLATQTENCGSGSACPGPNGDSYCGT